MTCLVPKLNVACFVLGAITFVVSTTMSLAAATYMVMAHHDTGATGLTLDNMKGREGRDPLLTWNIHKSAKELIFGIVLVLGVLWMLFSVALLYGVKKNKPSCVVAYFLFGVAISVLSGISAVLEFLAKQWALASATLVVTGLYVQCLRAVYSAYDQLQQGKSLGDQEQLVLDEEFSVEDE